MSGKKIKLGIIFNFNPSWMGGIIYILNLVKTLDFLDDEEKPEIIIFYRKDLRRFVDQINYPYLSAVEWEFPVVSRGYIKSWLTGRNVFINDIIRNHDLAALYPLHDFPVKTSSKTKLICWYADLQHEHYPEFFTRRKRIERTLRIKFILRNSDHLVVSSRAVESDFRRFFRLMDHLKVHVFHFVSVIDDFTGLELDVLRKKYGLPEKYYMVCNQFHKHKNHQVLLKAQALLREKGNRIHLAMTGRFPDPSHSPYMKGLHSIINDHDLGSQISLLGIIPRNEQLFLMRHAQAVIQPSLFEGWSTVIEDAISLQVPVIASSLPVNIEQLEEKGHYFEPHDEKKLAEILGNFPQRDLGATYYDSYNSRIREAARVFMKIIND